MPIRTTITRDYSTDGLLGVVEAAERAGVHPQTLRTHLSRGTGPTHYKETGQTGRIWIAPADLDAWVTARNGLRRVSGSPTAAGDLDEAVNAVAGAAPDLSPYQVDILISALKRGSRRGDVI